MKIEKDISLNDFRDEMQHRVVKYGHRSRPVKEAVRFARKQDDTAYYQVATDKVHAQRQFQRQTFGPSKTERLVDFLTLGSFREVFVMMLMVVAGIAGVELVKSCFEASKTPADSMSVEELAKRLGIGIDSTLQSGGPNPKGSPMNFNRDRTNSSRDAGSDQGAIDKLAYEIARILVENEELRSLTRQVESGEKSATLNNTGGSFEQATHSQVATAALPRLFASHLFGPVNRKKSVEKVNEANGGNSN